MAIKTIDTLIDKQDSWEIVRDQIALILATETLAQQTKADNAGKDPDLWTFDVYIERSKPWEIESETPIINVWYDNGNFPGGKGNSVDRQTHEGVVNIDVYGFGTSGDDPDNASGQLVGDELATLNCQRVVRLARNILMADVNTYLQLRGVVGKRWIQSITMFQPQLSETQVEYVTGGRIAIRPEFLEFSPQVTPEELENVFVTISDESRVLVELDFDVT